MNEEQKAVIGMFVAELEKKGTDELRSYLIVSYVIGFLSAVAGIGLLMLTMFIPTILMFIGAILVLPMAVRLSIVTDIMKKEVKRIIKSRTNDK